jgi:hypothetical protein
MRALFVLTPAESKRLIGKAVAGMEEVKRAKQKAKVLIGHGSTTVFVAEEILGKEKFSSLMNRNCYLSGVVVRGTLCTILGEEKPPILVLNRGTVEPPAPTMAELLRDFGRDSVFIKGANAVDPEGNAAVFVAHPEGGAIGWSIGTILARGIRLIVPVGLEKLIPSVKKAIPLCGQQTFDYCQGLRVGLVPLSGAKVVTEIDALRMLTGAESFHVASGGSSGSEGAVTLVAEGEARNVEKAIELTESIKGEPPLAPRKGICLTCVPSSPAQPKDYKVDMTIKRCLHSGKPEDDIPPYLRNR